MGIEHTFVYIEDNVFGLVIYEFAPAAVVGAGGKDQGAARGKLTLVYMVSGGGRPLPQDAFFVRFVNYFPGIQMKDSVVSAQEKAGVVCSAAGSFPAREHCAGSKQQRQGKRFKK